MNISSYNYNKSLLISDQQKFAFEPSRPYFAAQFIAFTATLLFLAVIGIRRGLFPRFPNMPLPTFRLILATSVLCGMCYVVKTACGIFNTLIFGQPQRIATFLHHIG